MMNVHVYATLLFWPCLCAKFILDSRMFLFSLLLLYQRIALPVYNPVLYTRGREVNSCTRINESPLPPKKMMEGKKMTPHHATAFQETHREEIVLLAMLKEGNSNKQYRCRQSPFFLPFFTTSRVMIYMRDLAM